jgi:hypothetical protein
MLRAHPRPNAHRSTRFSPLKWGLVFCLIILVALVSCPLTRAQSTSPSVAAPAACPVQLLSFDPSGVSVRIKNVSGKKIVGLVFNAALADATEHWKWYHWDFDEGRPIREFGWNKTIKDGATKKLSWYRADIDFEHGGGGAFVLTSALFEDGTVWEEPNDSASCKYVWYNSHKKSFVRPIALPFRQ